LKPHARPPARACLSVVAYPTRHAWCAVLKIKGGKKPASKCDVKTYEGCSEKEEKYLRSKASLDKGAIDTEIKRLTGMTEKKMADTQLAWLSARVNLLKKLEKTKDEL
jgi:hypothetical protein